MVYVVGYTREKELKEYSNSELGKDAMKELNLAQIAHGEDTTIWKPLNNGLYALVHSKKMFNQKIDQRTIPVAFGILMEQEEAMFLLNNIESFITIVDEVKNVSYSDVIAIPDMSPEESTDRWKRYFVNDDMYCWDQDKERNREYLQMINKASVYMAVSSNKIYLEQYPSLYDVLSYIELYPNAIQSKISFSFPFGGTAAGAVQLNFIREGSVFNPAGDGFSTDPYITDCDLKKENEEIDNLAYELESSMRLLFYHDYLKNRSCEEIIQKMEYIHTLRMINQMMSERNEVPLEYKAFAEREWKHFWNFLPFLKEDPISINFELLCHRGPGEATRRIRRHNHNEYCGNTSQLHADDETKGQSAEHRPVRARKKKKGSEKKHATPDGKRCVDLIRFAMLVDCSVSGLLLVLSLLLSGMIHYNYIQLTSDYEHCMVFFVTERDAIQFLLLLTVFLSLWTILKWIFVILVRKIVDFFQQKRE